MSDKIYNLVTQASQSLEKQIPEQEKKICEDLHKMGQSLVELIDVIESNLPEIRNLSENILRRLEEEEKKPKNTQTYAKTTVIVDAKKIDVDKIIIWLNKVQQTFIKIITEQRPLKYSTEEILTWKGTTSSYSKKVGRKAQISIDLINSIHVNLEIIVRHGDKFYTHSEAVNEETGEVNWHSTQEKMSSKLSEFCNKLPTVKKYLIKIRNKYLTD